MRSKKTEDCIRAIRESPLPARVIYANACDILLTQCDIFADGKSDIRLTASSVPTSHDPSVPQGAESFLMNNENLRKGFAIHSSLLTC